jgi:hypothetical protein
MEKLLGVLDTEETRGTTRIDEIEFRALDEALPEVPMVGAKEIQDYPGRPLGRVSSFPTVLGRLCRRQGNL